jgi:hypothetical protein
LPSFLAGDLFIRGDLVGAIRATGLTAGTEFRLIYEARTTK